MDDDEHQDFRTNPFQGGGDDGSRPNPLHGPYSIQGSSSSKAPIIRSMMRKIQKGLDQQEPNKLNGLHMLSSWAKEDITT